jgi:hypothetical protein
LRVLKPTLRSVHETFFSKSYHELIELGANEANHEKIVPVKDKGSMQTAKASLELAPPGDLSKKLSLPLNMLPLLPHQKWRKGMMMSLKQEAINSHIDAKCP